MTDEARSQQAMDLSQTASRLLRLDRLDEAIEAYQKALDIYQQTMKTSGSATDGSVISVCNAGSCWRNLGAIQRKRQNISKAIESWKRAEELYRHGREQVFAHRKLCESEVLRSKQPVVSLYVYLVETLQTRATLHTRPGDAMECHEEAIDLLMETCLGKEEPAWYAKLTEPLGTVIFGPMEKEKRIEHILTSLEALGELYTSTGAYQDGLSAFVEALEFVRDRDEMGNWNERISQIFHTLSDLYIEKHDWKMASEAIEAALDVCPKPPPDELLEAIDRIGRHFEEEERDLERAMSLYEKVLLVRNQYLGDMHVDVAKSLINVARIMELQGNEEGSMDIYRAAQAIYTRQVTSNEFHVAPEDVQSLLRLIPNVMEQGRYEEAVAYLNKCLESDNEELDKTQIYFDLGQAYIGMGDYVSATVCLVECAKQDGAVSDEQIDQLLDHVEFLKQEQEAAFTRSHVPSTSEGEQDNTQEDSRSEEENRSLTSHTERSPVPISSVTVSDEEEEHVDIRIERRERMPLSPHKSPREQENSTPLTADFSRTASKSDHISVEGQQFWTSDEGEAGNAGDDEDEKHDSPRRSKGAPALVTPGPRSQASANSVRSGTPSPVEAASASPLEISTDFEKQDPASSPQTERETYQTESSKSGAPLDYSANMEFGRSADTRGLLEPSDVEDESPSTSRQSSKARSRTRSVSSPRKKRVSSPRWKIESKSSDSTKEKKNLFRRRKRQGFESLPEERTTPSPPLERENEYHLDESSYVVDAPVQVIVVEPDWDDVSEISYNPNGRPGSRNRTNEWWWGVTAEGFGRWFPSNFVSQAVEAADGFLSAKAIHSKVKSAPLHISEDESLSDRESQPTEEQASHLGVASKRHHSNAYGSSAASREFIEPLDTNAANLTAMLGPQSPVRRKRQDVLSDIRECSQQIAEQRMKLDENDPALGETLFRLALLHGQNQNIGAASEAAASALRIQKLSSNFVMAAKTLHFLAGLKLQEREYKSALSFYSEALRLETNLYGKFSEECAKTLNAIGTVRSLQNEFKLAMDSHKEALHVLKECHGDDVQGNPLVSQTLCQIGAVYYRERNALSTIKSQSGDYTTFIEAGMLEIIGRAHEERGSYKMAIAFFEEKLQFLENAPDNKAAQDELATMLNSLGMLSSRAGLFMEAVDYYEKALAIQMKIENDIVYMSTAKVLTATVQFQLGFWHKSLQLLQEALPILERELGEKHETVAATYYHVGVVQAAMCDYDAAMTSFSDAYAVQENLLGVSHPASLRTRREIANLHAVYKSELDYSFELFTEVLAAQQKIHGPKHPNIAETLHSIGVAYAQKGEDSTALKTLEECYYMRLEFLGVDHPLQATTLHEIAKIHIKKGRARKATSICDTVLEIRKESLSEWHIDYARALATKGSSLSMRGEFPLATKCLDEALRVAKQSVFASHPAIGEIQLEMGLLWLRKCQFSEAKKCAEIAEDIFRKANFDNDHPGLLRVGDLLDRIERDEALYV